MNAKSIIHANQLDIKEMPRGTKSANTPALAVLNDASWRDSGLPGGGQGRIDLTGIITNSFYIDPFMTEGHLGYLESGQSEIIPEVAIAGDMLVKDAIYSRRATRDYTDRSVSKQTVSALIEAAIHAPSAINQQPWSFVVIQDRAVLKSYSNIGKTLFVKSGAHHSVPDSVKDIIADPEFNIFYNAATLVIICAKPIGQHPDWDCCFAAQNLMLMAHAMDLATCPIGFAWILLSDPDIRVELHIPTDYVPVLPIIIGYPNKPVAQVSRKESEVLCWK